MPKAQTAMAVTCEADELMEGLFGQVFLWVFEVLPFLAKNSQLPAMDIKSMRYGPAPGYTVIPGVLDLAYSPPEHVKTRVALNQLRDRHGYVLGNDWDA